MSEPPSKIMKVGNGSCPLVEYINPKNIVELLGKEFFGPNSASQINSTERNLVKLLANELRKLEEYSVFLCRDVLVEVLRYGDRLRLTKLERIGRRLHWTIENFFREMPFMRLNLELQFPMGSRLDAFIFSDERKIVCPVPFPKAILTDLPQFVRFDRVLLWYYGELSIEEKFKLYGNYLQLLKKALNDANSIKFFCKIDQNDGHAFRNHSQLLNHVQNDLLAICDSSRGYAFVIDLHSDTNAGANVMDQILEMHPIGRCSNLEIKIIEFYGRSEHQIQLPIELISNWLHRKLDGINEKSKERFLRISSENIQNIREMCNHLKTLFKDANFRVRPFTLELRMFFDEPIDTDEVVTNKNTSEQLSIRKRRTSLFDRFSVLIEIKRGAMKKNSEIS